MSLDHYVSQVHLKNFYSPSLGGLMYAIRKSDLKLFTPDAKSVCRIEEGSTNSYLRMDRIVEEFLKGIEPRYNVALEKLTGRGSSLPLTLVKKKICKLGSPIKGFVK